MDLKAVRGGLAAPFMKMILMAASVLLVQLSFDNLSQEAFLFFNKLTFLVAFHTTTTYSSQVEIWESKGITSKKSIFFGMLMALLASLFFFKLGSLVFFLSAVFYISAKFFDRLVFNIVLSKGRIFFAYSAAIFGLLLEMFVWWCFPSDEVEVVARFLAPGVVLSVLLVVGLVFFSGESLSGNNFLKDRLGTFLLNLHSLSILLVVMLDRFLIGDSYYFINISPAQYLLLFSYAGSVYALVVSAVEVNRVSYYEVAKKSSGINDFLVQIEFSKLLIRYAASYFSACVFGGGGLAYFWSKSDKLRGF